LALVSRSRERVREEAVEEGEGVKIDTVRDWFRVSCGGGGGGGRGVLVR
jgi:hypothetical protein